MQFLALIMALACLLPAHAAPRPRKAEKNLTLELARQRRKQVSRVAYDISFVLEAGKEEYHGRTTITAELARTDLPLSLDFEWKTIHTLTVNGKAVEPVKRLGSFDIPAKHLASQTTIVVEYTNDYSKEGMGLQRAVDPEDGAEYVFTDFEPYYAHTLFPCFDQPDLKAPYRLRVDAPADWKVIGNEMVQSHKEDDGRQQVVFAATPPISSYLVFLGAGPFKEWTDKAGKIPLTLYARKSLAKHVDADEIFSTTKKGLAFFGEYFGRPYPFSKYGQVFIPEFAWGGMENPGAIALNERNIYRGPVPQTRRDDRDNLILHEMAHMWFGDLVTMEWWNDLWLNESFASYLASVAMDRAMGKRSAWMDFFNDKAWGYWQDQLVTTHPIETPVADTRTAKGNFDGITYAKGASTLKQLHFYAGEDGFRGGLKAYFAKYPFMNATRADFIQEISAASKLPLDAWTKAWLQTAGPNRVHTSFDCRDGKVASLRLEQRPSVSGALAPHRTRLGFYTLQEGQLTLQKTLDAAFAGRTQDVKEAQGAPCPDFVLPNQEDQDYALYPLDAASLRHVRSALLTMQDPLARLMVWHSLKEMVRDAQLPPMEFFEHALAALAEEKDDALLGFLLGRHSFLREQYFHYLTPVQRVGLAPRLEETLWKRVESAERGSSLQMLFFDFHTSVARSPAALARLRAALDGKPPRGIQMDQDRRWTVVTVLASQGAPEAAAVLEAEAKRDATTVGKRNAYAAGAALPDFTSKKKYWDEFLKGDLTYSNFRAAAGLFTHADHQALTRPYAAKLLAHLERFDWAKHDILVDVYFENLFPQEFCDAKFLADSQRSLKRARTLTPLARRGWREANDELARCARVRMGAR